MDNVQAYYQVKCRLLFVYFCVKMESVAYVSTEVTGVTSNETRGRTCMEMESKWKWPSFNF